MKILRALMMFVGIATTILVAAAAVDERLGRPIRRWLASVFESPMTASSPGEGGHSMGPMPAPGAPADHEAAPGERGGASQAAATIYYCPMHPSYRSDKPGECPICSMTLVPLHDDAQAVSSGVDGHAAVHIPEYRQQLIGVTTGRVEWQPVARTIRALGRVEYDETRRAAVSLKFGGWVDELAVKFTGQSVQIGAPLLVIYSPELLEAERNYVLALEAKALLPPAAAGQQQSFAETNVRTLRERLLLADITEEQIRELERTRQPQTLVTLHSRVEGVVIERDVVRGAFIEPGTTLFEVADLATVWLHADVYEDEIPLIKLGLEARVDLASLPGESLTGKIVYIYPFLNEQTRTVKVRLELQNAEGRLKPGMYATAHIAVDLGEQLVVDDQAIVDSGNRQLVFVDRGEGRFDPREVVVGPRADGHAVILDGLEAGEKVVTSGNFLVDSESRLRSALLQGTHASGHQH
ncbi:MAG: efflux RND transporter periplasmic adaptor subunit [Planctomycetota bacterium]